MPGLISDRDGSSYSQLSAAMHAFAEMYGPRHSAKPQCFFFPVCATAIRKREREREKCVGLIK